MLPKMSSLDYIPALSSIDCRKMLIVQAVVAYCSYYFHDQCNSNSDSIIIAQFMDIGMMRETLLRHI